MKMSKESMQIIIDHKLIYTCSEDEKRQINEFAFGSEFMASDNKGELVTYENQSKDN